MHDIMEQDEEQEQSKFSGQITTNVKEQKSMERMAQRKTVLDTDRDRLNLDQKTCL